MTAIAVRRTRRTVIGVAVALALVSMASTMFAVGFVTLSNSQEGESVGVDTRPRVQLPVTPNALVALTDESGRLASLVVMTLLPEGQGGSIVTVPVNADATAGFGEQRRPLDESFDAANVDGLLASVEEMLSITVQRAEVVDARELEAILPAIGVSQFVAPGDVVDTRGGGGVIATAGPHSFTLTEMVSILAAIDDEAEIDASHPNDVAVWSSLVRSAPVSVPPEPIPLDALGNPAEPTSVAELVTRLWQGEVAVRELLTLPTAEVENPTQVDVVLIDRRDSTLVFSQVSPALVSAPNTGLKARIVANFTDEQLATTGELYDSSSALVIELIGRLLFLSGNVVSVDTAATGAPAVTIIEVADERQLQETIDAAKTLFGEAEVRVSKAVLEGVDTQVTLGVSYLAYELARGGSAATPVDTSIVESTLPEAPSSTDMPGTVAGDG